MIMFDRRKRRAGGRLLLPCLTALALILSGVASAHAMENPTPAEEDTNATQSAGDPVSNGATIDGGSTSGRARRSRASRSLTLHDVKPRTATFEFHAPTGGYGTAETVHTVTIDGNDTLTLPTAEQLASWAGGEDILHPDTHAGQGFSGNADWEFVGWSILTMDDTYTTVQEDGSTVTATDFTDPNQDEDSVYWEPGRTYTPPTAGTLTSSAANATDAWWNMHGDFVPVYRPYIRYHANGGGGSMESSTLLTSPNRFTVPAGIGNKAFSGWATEKTGGTIYAPLTFIPQAVTTLGALGTINPNYGVDETMPACQPMLLYAQWNVYGMAYPARIEYEGIWSERNPIRPTYDNIEAPEEVNRVIDRYRNDWEGWNVGGASGAFDNQPFDTELPHLGYYTTSGVEVCDYQVQYWLRRGEDYRVETLGRILEGKFTLTWNTKPDGSGTTYQPGSTFHVPLGVTTLYAQFTPVSPTVIPDVHVSYDANGGSGVMNGHTVQLGDTMTVKRNAFSRQNHRFTGWNTQPDGGGDAYAPGAVIQPEKDMTLYAQWETVEYPLVYDLNGGTGTTPNG